MAALAAGLRQRVRALNAFIGDIYHEQDILRAAYRAGADLLQPQYRPEMQDMDVPGGIYAHIAGIDVVRAGPASSTSSRTTARAPGVSYMLEDRKIMMRLFLELFALNRVAPVEHYPDRLFGNLASVAPDGVADPVVVSRPARTRAPTSSTRSSRSRWASNWSKGRICSYAKDSSTCAPRVARSAST